VVSCNDEQEGERMQLEQGYLSFTNLLNGAAYADGEPVTCPAAKKFNKNSKLRCRLYYCRSRKFNKIYYYYNAFQ
jgi:hypothetical protein